MASVFTEGLRVKSCVQNPSFIKLYILVGDQWHGHHCCDSANTKWIVQYPHYCDISTAQFYNSLMSCFQVIFNFSISDLFTVIHLPIYSQTTFALLFSLPPAPTSLPLTLSLSLSHSYTHTYHLNSRYCKLCVEEAHCKCWKVIKTNITEHLHQSSQFTSLRLRQGHKQSCIKYNMSCHSRIVRIKKLCFCVSVQRICVSRGLILDNIIQW